MVLNLPGLDLYDLSLHWVYIVRENGSITTDTFWYIDDGRPIANIAWKYWKAARKVGCTRCYLDLQDASRKRIEFNRVPGEWTGTLVKTLGDRTSVLVPSNKWMKGKTSWLGFGKSWRG